MEAGLFVGMKKDEILSKYPNMAMIGFDGTTTKNGISGHQGWNGNNYPRSYVGMDDEWEYAGRDYAWTDQFDYALIGDIDDAEDLPKYIGLLVKNDSVAAITFYYPTAD